MALLPGELHAGPITLSRWRPALLDELLHAIELSQPELAAWMAWADPMPTRDAQHDVLARGEDEFDRDVDYGYVMIGGYEIVGGCGLHRRLARGGIEIGYWVRSDRTGHGYATAASRTLTTAAFDHLGVDRVEIHMDKANERSAAVPRRLGYALAREEDRERVTRGQTGRWLVWVMTRAGWTGGDAELRERS